MNMTMEDVLERARVSGEKAPVMSLPSPTVDGLAAWKKDLLVYFGCAADNLINEVGGEPEMRGEILAAMKEGFEKMLIAQPHEEIPAPLDVKWKETEKEMSLRIVREVFNELPVSPHHCTR